MEDSNRRSQAVLASGGQKRSKSASSTTVSLPCSVVCESSALGPCRHEGRQSWSQVCSRQCARKQAPDRIDTGAKGVNNSGSAR